MTRYPTGPGAGDVEPPTLLEACEDALRDRPSRLPSPADLRGLRLHQQLVEACGRASGLKGPNLQGVGR